MSGHGKNILLVWDHLMQLSLQYFFSDENCFIFQLPDSGPRVCEQAWGPTERGLCRPRPTPTLISTQWSATPPPPSSSPAPGPPPPAGPTVTSPQVRHGVRVSLIGLGLEHWLSCSLHGKWCGGWRWCYYPVMIPPGVSNNDGPRYCRDIN